MSVITDRSKSVGHKTTVRTHRHEDSAVVLYSGVVVVAINLDGISRSDNSV